MADAKSIGKKLAQSGRALASANKQSTGKAALAMKQAVLTEAKKDSGGDLRLSRFGRNGVKLNAGYDIEGTSDTRTTVTARPMGPWKVLEYGAKPHVIVAGLTRRQQRAASLFQLMAGGGEVNAADVASVRRGNRNNRRTRRRASRKQALTIGGNVRPYAQHPGTRPKRTWTRGVAKGGNDAAQAYAKAQADAWRKAVK